MDNWGNNPNIDWKGLYQILYSLLQSHPCPNTDLLPTKLPELPSLGLATIWAATLLLPEHIGLLPVPLGQLKRWMAIHVWQSESLWHHFSKPRWAAFPLVGSWRKIPMNTGSCCKLLASSPNVPTYLSTWMEGLVRWERTAEYLCKGHNMCSRLKARGRGSPPPQVRWAGACWPADPNVSGSSFASIPQQYRED